MSVAAMCDRCVVSLKISYDCFGFREGCPKTWAITMFDRQSQTLSTSVEAAVIRTKFWPIYCVDPYCCNFRGPIDTLECFQTRKNASQPASVLVDRQI